MVYSREMLNCDNEKNLNMIILGIIFDGLLLDLFNLYNIMFFLIIFYVWV